MQHADLGNRATEMATESNMTQTDVSDSQPDWASLVRPSAKWRWDRGCLVEEGANYFGHPPARAGNPIARFIVSHVYGRQNRSKAVRETIAGALSRLPKGRYGLNFGAGGIDYGQRVLDLDVGTHLVVDILSAGSLEIPLQDSSLSLVISQEVLEHVRDPRRAVKEFHRVLAADGELVLQLPFMIGYHPGPEDFWRFSVEAYDQLLPADRWEILAKRISVGHGSGFHRVLTEFAAVHFSVFGGKIYRASKGFFALLFAPFILFDLLTDLLPEKHRIPGGYIVRAKPRK